MLSIILLEISLIRPKELSDSLESVNKLFHNSSRTNGRNFFLPARILKLKVLCAYFRRCLTTNCIPDIRLITQNDINTYMDYLKSWLRKADKVQDTISTITIKFDHSYFI